MFFVPHHFLDGGVIGVGLIAYYWFGFKPGLTIILFSVPLYIFAFFKNRTLFYNSVHGLWLSSMMIDFFHHYSASFTLPPLMSAMIGGGVVGIGIGLMLRGDSATGGSDLLAQLIGKSFRLNVGKLIFIFDTIVLLIGWPIIGTEAFLYSLLAVSSVGFFTTILTHQREGG